MATLEARHLSLLSDAHARRTRALTACCHLVHPTVRCVMQAVASEAFYDNVLPCLATAPSQDHIAQSACHTCE